MNTGKAVLFGGAYALLIAWAPLSALASTPNDPLFPQQWGLSGRTASINAPEAWCASTGAGVLVADVDTGANFGHEDLGGRLVPGAAFTGGSGQMTGSGQSAVQDGVGHGSMTVGLMVANKDNGLGIAGVAPAARALVVKVFADDGSGTTNDGGAGIRWAADNGARAINASFGSDLGGLGTGIPNPVDTNISNAVSYATQHGAMVALAAGNSGLPASEYQAVSSAALVVGALSRDGTAASYSTNGVGVNIWAPGGDGSTGGWDVNVISTYKGAANAYAVEAGTSFAAPHVTATLALLISRGYSPADARQRILSTAVNRSGLPELDAAAALGTSGGCPGTPPTTNNPATSARPGGATRSTRPGTSSQAASPAAIPSPASPPSPEVALVVPGTAATASASGTLTARAAPPRPTYGFLGLRFGASQALWALAVAALAGVVSGYGALRFIMSGAHW
jgi:subtilisin family serine protease